MLATAGDDGTILLWVHSETHNPASAFGEDGLEDKETWRVKHMCRSFGTEIYDLAWSPDALFFMTGSMDNIARIYNAQTGRPQSYSHEKKGNADSEKLKWFDKLLSTITTFKASHGIH